jgi:3-oxoacyl-[acyl-carrier-protein] synthase II
LFDAIMLLKEQEADNILVGGTEEMVDVSFTVLTRLGIYKRWPLSNLELFSTESSGTIGGEGAVFFLLTDKQSADNLAELTAIKTLYKPKNPEESIVDFLAENSLKIDDIDLIITGKNGDTRNDAVYKQIGLLNNVSLANYKHLCGEYPTSSSFALWLGANMIKRAVMPEIVMEKTTKETAPKKILIYNHYQNKYHSLMLISAI